MASNQFEQTTFAQALINAVPQALTDAQSVKLFAEMRQIVFRGLTGVLGFLAALVAVSAPILFISNSLTEAGSVRQHGGHFSLAGAVGGSLAVLALAGFFAFVAFTLLRFAFRGPSPMPPSNVPS